MKYRKYYKITGVCHLIDLVLELNGIMERLYKNYLHGRGLLVNLTKTAKR